MYQEIVTMQYDVNTRINGDAWLKDSDKYDFLSAIRDEVVELATSAGWRPWWKAGEVSELDMENAQLEIVDIYHFHISELLQSSYLDIAFLQEQIEDGELTLDDVDGLEDFEWVGDFSTFLANPRDRLIKHVASILAHNSTMAQHSNEINAYRTLHHYLGSVLSFGSENATADLFTMAHAYGLDANLFNALYIAKNALNRFRKDNNYKGDKEGMPPYVKHWADGKEDNYYVMAHVRTLLESGSDITLDSMYASIQSMYDFYTK